MSNLIRFEFYNNFDIWYDLYQENGGDPNYIINMMMYINKNDYGNEYEFRYGPECKSGYGYGQEHGNILGSGKGHGYGYGDGLGNGYGFRYGIGFGNGFGYEYGFRRIFVYWNENGNIYTGGNGN